MRETDLLLAVVLADVGIVLVVAAALRGLSRFARQPTVVGEIVAGIALGPSILGLLPGDLTDMIFPAEGRPLLSAVAQVGVLLFMFVLGWELNSGQLRRAKGAVAAVSSGSIAVPFAMGVGAALLVHGRHDLVPGPPFALYMGVAMSVTALPVLARIISDGGWAHTRVGALALASAALGDLVAWCLLAVVVGLTTAGHRIATLAWSAVYLVAMAAVVRPLLGRLVFRLSAGVHLVPLVAAGALLSSFVTTAIGIHAIFGAFAFGIAMPRQADRDVETAVQRPIQDAARLLLPVYFVVTGLSVDVGALHGQDWLDLVLLLAVACVGKLAGATLPARWTGLPWREAVSVGVLLNTRGLTELIILDIGLSAGILDERLFTMMVLIALLTTAMTGPLLPLLAGEDGFLASAPRRRVRPNTPVAPPGVGDAPPRDSR